MFFKIVAQVGENFQSSDGRTLAQLLEDKTRDLCKKFKELYGDSGEEMWKRLLDRNS